MMGSLLYDNRSFEPSDLVRLSREEMINELLTHVAAEYVNLNWLLVRYHLYLHPRNAVCHSQKWCATDGNRFTEYGHDPEDAVLRCALKICRSFKGG